jgi:hypothetical protein
LLSNKKLMKKVYSILIIACLVAVGMLGQTQEVTLDPSKDNSIYEESELSNGAGQYLFTGRTLQDNRRRALLKFDLSEAVPEGHIVDSASLVLVPSLVKTDGTTVAIYKVTTFWGEGSSDAEGPEGKGAPATDGDATWIKSVVSGDPWVKPGGDFDLQPIADTSVFLGTDALFESAFLTSLVNSWIEDPTSNHGVIVKGDETKKGSAIRFNSREFANSGKLPMLKLYYQGATSALPEKVNTDNFSVYPDISSGDLVIRNSFGPVKGRIELYSITGSLLYSSKQQFTEGENRIYPSIEGSGIYIYRVISEAGILSGKFSVQTR